MHFLESLNFVFPFMLQCGGGKTPDLPTTPAATPIPMPSDTASQLTEGQRAGKIKNLKAGIMSTVKTTPQGAIGTGPELNTPEGAVQKKNLGA